MLFGVRPRSWMFPNVGRLFWIFSCAIIRGFRLQGDGGAFAKREFRIQLCRLPFAKNEICLFFSKNEVFLWKKVYLSYAMSDFGSFFSLILFMRLFLDPDFLVFMFEQVKNWGWRTSGNSKHNINIWFKIEFYLSKNFRVKVIHWVLTIAWNFRKSEYMW